MSRNTRKPTIHCPSRVLFQLDPEHEVILVKCRDCSRRHGRPIYHRIALAELHGLTTDLKIGDTDRRPDDLAA